MVLYFLINRKGLLLLAVSDTMEVILKRLEEKPMLGKLQDMTWVYLVDSGGQPQFHELLTAFAQKMH